MNTDTTARIEPMDGNAILLQVHSAEPWAMRALATIVGRALDPVKAESLRWEDAMDYAMGCTRAPRNV